MGISDFLELSISTLVKAFKGQRVERESLSLRQTWHRQTDEGTFIHTFNISNPRAPVGAIIELNILWRVADEEALVKCFERDIIPVETSNIYEGFCLDDKGNRYQENSTLTSCCECIM